MKNRYADSVPYRTLDGSLVRELMHPRLHGTRAQSLAEATIAAGGQTFLHRHNVSEEIYHVSTGAGWVWLADRWLSVRAGDTVCIAPGTLHCAKADRHGPLVILCCCSPAYGHDDTDLLEDAVPPVEAPSGP